MPSLKTLNGALSNRNQLVVHRWLRVFSTILAFLVNLRLPRGVASSALDSSWAQVLAHSLMQHQQWGRQLIFTYGPLGFITPYMGYVRGLFFPYMVTQLVFASLFAFEVWRATSSFKSRQLTLLIVLFGTLGFWVAGDAAWMLSYIFSVAAMTQLAGAEINTSKRMVNAVILCALPSLLPLVKITLLAPWLVWLLATTIICLIYRDRRLACTTLFMSVAFLLLGWHFCGQALSNLWSYLSGSFQIASGYAEAMGTADSNPATDYFGLLALALGLCMIAHNMHQARRPSHYLLGLTYAAILLCAFRVGFTRADWVHIPIFSAVCLLSVASLPKIAERSKENTAPQNRIGTVLLTSSIITQTAIFAACLPGDLAYRTITGSLTQHEIATLFQFAFRPTALIASYRDQAASALEAETLPEIRKMLGNDSIDVVSYEQGLAYANGLNLSFRPIFQSYSVYTQELIDKNNAFYRSDRAPDWVLYKLQSIDSRLPSEDDASLFFTLAETYSIAGAEKGYLLLHRMPAQATSSCTADRPTMTATAINEWLELPNDQKNLLKISIDYDLSVAGKLRSAILRPPTAFMEIRNEKGAIRRYRLVHAIAKNGFLASPVLNNSQEYLDWRSGKYVQKAIAVRMVPAQPGDSRYFIDQIKISSQPLNCVTALASADSASAQNPVTP